VFAGAYSYMADAGIFAYCDTGARYPVAMQADNVALERAYLGVPHEPGAPVIVTLLGRLEPMLPMEGSTPRDHLIVERFLQVWPGETCEKLGVETTLVNTYWKLVELGGEAVVPRENQREVHLTLHIDGNRAAGFAGCNQFTGVYEHEGGRVRFSRMAATLMACNYLDDERAFLQTLERVTSYQILGESLDLRDDAGTIARFRAVYLR
jgi:copper homeostasis protein (lipoprotein)